MTLPRPVTESYSRRVGLSDPRDIMCMPRSFGRCRFSILALRWQTKARGHDMRKSKTESTRKEEQEQQEKGHNRGPKGKKEKNFVGLK